MITVYRKKQLKQSAKHLLMCFRQSYKFGGDYTLLGSFFWLGFSVFSFILYVQAREKSKVKAHHLIPCVPLELNRVGFFLLLVQLLFD